MKLLIACLFFAWAHIVLGQAPASKSAGPISPYASATPLTQEQGEEILNELRLIRKALEDRRDGSTVRSTNAMPPQSAKMTIDPNWFALGSDRAPVTVVEFSDFQCPYCTQFNRDTFPKIKTAYIDTGKVRFVSREYPLQSHSNALLAAQAARCAGAQDKYWQMRESIIDNSSDLSASAFDKEAQKLALDIPQFKACMKDDHFVAAIQRDISDGQRLGVTGTPAFFIGSTQDKVIEGVRIDGALPYDQFASAIDSALTADGAAARAH